MSISFKYIIHKVDKLINPKKYYTNNITKNIKNLEKGDTVYVVRIPDIEHMSISMSFSALEEIEMKKCILDEKIITFKIIDLRIYVENPTYKFINGLNYYVVGDFNGHPTRNYIIRFYLDTKDVHNSFIMKTTYGKILVTTDKNTIIKHINQMADVIKDRLNERLKEEEKYIADPIDDTVYYRNNYNCDYCTTALRNFKKQYANLRNQVRML